MVVIFDRNGYNKSHKKAVGSAASRTREEQRGFAVLQTEDAADDLSVKTLVLRAVFLLEGGRELSADLSLEK